MNKYFKLIVAVFALCLWGVRLHAQSFQWVYATGPTMEWTGISRTEPSKIFTDSKENVYFCFAYEGIYNLTFAGERVFVPDGQDGTCAGVACYDCQGSLKWYRTFFGKLPWNHSTGMVGLNNAAMVDDTLVLFLNGYFDSLYVCDSERVLDTVVCNQNYALWLNTDDGRPIRTAHIGFTLQPHYYNNRLHVLGGCGAYDTIPGMMDDSTYIQIFTPQGEKIRHLALDYSSSYPEGDDRFVVYHDKYYLLYPMCATDSCRFGNQLYTGHDNLFANTVFACFDSLGRCLWSRLLNNWVYAFGQESRMAIDTSAGRIYLVSEVYSYNFAGNHLLETFDGDTIWGVTNNCARLPLACYDTLGNKLWLKYSRGPGEFRGRCIQMLPDHKLAIGGGANFYDAVFEGFHTNALDGLDSFASFFMIYDCLKDSVELLQVNRSLQRAMPTMQFATDRNGNLYFESHLEKKRDYVVCGNDTIRSIGYDAQTIVYGRYGWGCDTVAHWPGPPQYTLTLNANQDDMGFVTGAGIYSGGSRVPISATPYPGHTFDRWSDGTSINPRTVILDTDSTITAHFVKTQTDPEGITSADHPHMALYPNPATGRVQILGLAGEAQYVEILDMTGRTAATFRYTSTLDISHLPQGSYIVKIQTAEGSIQHLKLIKE